jgi:hypothetical protein
LLLSLIFLASNFACDSGDDGDTGTEAGDGDGDGDTTGGDGDGDATGDGDGDASGDGDGDAGNQALGPDASGSATPGALLSVRWALAGAACGAPIDGCTSPELVIEIPMPSQTVGPKQVPDELKLTYKGCNDDLSFEAGTVDITAIDGTNFAATISGTATDTVDANGDVAVALCP